MAYRVISRFFDRVRKVYVDPDARCPDLAPEEAARLVRAKCLAEVAEESPPARRRREISPPVEPPAPGG